MAEDKIPLFVLNDTNWHSWSVKMKALLLKRGYWDIQTRLPYDVSHPEETAKAVAEMLLRVEDHLLTIVDEAHDASQAWHALQSIFLSQSVNRRVALKKELNTMRKQAYETMAQYVDRGQKLRTELRAAGLTVAEFEVVEALIVGLPKDLDVSKTVLMNQDTTTMSLAWLRNKLAAMETHDDAEDAMVLYARMKPKQRSNNRVKEERLCYYCHKPGHIAANCRLRKQEEGEHHGQEQYAFLF